MTRGTKTRTNHVWRQMVFAIAAAAALATAEATTAQTRLTGDDIERIARSVVRIDALRNGELVGTGSGTIIWPTGRIVTNRHVIENSEDWQIAILRDIDERPVPQYRASLQGYSEEVDIALLQIDRWADGKPLVSENLNLPTAVWAEWHLQRGDYVGLFGYPGIGGGLLTFTEGGITTVHRGSVGGETASVAYQTDAEIAPGNSGGLAVNGNGEMVGIPSAAMTEATGGRLGVIITLDALVKATNAGLQTDLRNTDRLFVDAFAEATYGTLLVQAGRRPEGHTAAGIAGGPMDVANVIDGCRGWVSTPPDYRIRWTGRAESLGITFRATESAASTDDTTLTIRTPDGRWFCNDDSAGSMDPMIIIDDPEPGDYTAWAGILHKRCVHRRGTAGPRLRKHPARGYGAGKRRSGRSRATGPRRLRDQPTRRVGDPIPDPRFRGTRPPLGRRACGGVQSARMHDRPPAGGGGPPPSPRRRVHWGAAHPENTTIGGPRDRRWASARRTDLHGRTVEEPSNGLHDDGGTARRRPLLGADAAVR